MNDSAYLVIAAIALAVLVGIRRRREQVRHNLRGLAIAIVAGLIAFGIAQSQGTDAAWFWGIAAGAATLALQPKRSRYIPAAIRRQKRAEYELVTGKKYNPRKLHLDHIVPFSRGGSNTADNLRVIKKRENLKRGAKPPWWDLLGRL